MAEQLAYVRDEIAADNAQADAEAEALRERAEADIATATELMVDARRLADKASDDARQAADEARRKADELADGANSRVADTDKLRQAVGVAAADAVRELDGDDLRDLSQHTKQELLEVATSLDVGGRSSMTKDELVSAIKKTAKAEAAKSHR